VAGFFFQFGRRLRRLFEAAFAFVFLEGHEII
jgi:hypothetical protein